MSKNFTHYGFQTSRPTDEIEKLLKSIGINGFMEFNKNEDGVYLLSGSPLEGWCPDTEPETKTSLSEYSVYDLKMELLERDKKK